MFRAAGELILTSGFEMGFVKHCRSGPRPLFSHGHPMSIHVLATLDPTTLNFPCEELLHQTSQHGNVPDAAHPRGLIPEGVSNRSSCVLRAVLALRYTKVQKKTFSLRLGM